MGNMTWNNPGKCFKSNKT